MVDLRSNDVKQSVQHSPLKNMRSSEIFNELVKCIAFLDMYGFFAVGYNNAPKHLYSLPNSNAAILSWSEAKYFPAHRYTEGVEKSNASHYNLRFGRRSSNYGDKIDDWATFKIKLFNFEDGTYFSSFLNSGWNTKDV